MSPRLVVRRAKVLNMERGLAMKSGSVTRWMAGLCLGVLVATTGCTHVPGGIAPSNIPIGTRKYREIGRVSTTDSAVRLFGILPISGSNSIYAALRKCIEAKRADAMIEITVESYSQYWILFSRDIIKVEGTAIEFVRDPVRTGGGD
jgi:hypothetical protein